MFSSYHPLVRYWFFRFLRMGDEILSGYIDEYDHLDLAQKEALAAIEAMAED